jgi:hypothetical protein
VLHFYGIGYAGVMALPIRTFWLMSGNIDRIWAQQDMRGMTLAMVGQSTQESVAAYRDQLVIETGTMVKLGKDSRPEREPERDEEGFAELKRMT